MNLMDVVYRPCVGVEEYTWLWWAKGCWMFPSATDAAVGLALVGAAGALVWWTLRRAA